MGCPVVMGNYDEGAGFEREDCGYRYLKPFDIEMSEVSFRWTRDHTSDDHKAQLRELPREIRLKSLGKRPFGTRCRAGFRALETQPIRDQVVILGVNSHDTRPRPPQIFRRVRDRFAVEVSRPARHLLPHNDPAFIPKFQDGGKKSAAVLVEEVRQGVSGFQEHEGVN